MKNLGCVLCLCLSVQSYGLQQDGCFRMSHAILNILEEAPEGVSRYDLLDAGMRRKLLPLAKQALWQNLIIQSQLDPKKRDMNLLVNLVSEVVYGMMFWTARNYEDLLEDLGGESYSGKYLFDKYALGDHVLDIAPGSGLYWEPRLDEIKELWGVDPFVTELDKIQLPWTRYITEDFSEFAKNFDQKNLNHYFDRIVSFYGLSYLPAHSFGMKGFAHDQLGSMMKMLSEPGQLLLVNAFEAFQKRTLVDSIVLIQKTARALKKNGTLFLGPIPHQSPFLKWVEIVSNPDYFRTSNDYGVEISAAFNDLKQFQILSSEVLVLKNKVSVNYVLHLYRIMLDRMVGLDEALTYYQGTLTSDGQFIERELFHLVLRRKD